SDNLRGGVKAGPVIVSEPQGHFYVEDVQQLDEVVGPAGGDGAGTHGVFECEIPADDPGEKFAERGVGVGIGAAGKRNHGRELGIAKAREGASKAGKHEGEHERGTGVVCAESGEYKDTGADDGAHTECGELASA